MSAATARPGIRDSWGALLRWLARVVMLAGACWLGLGVALYMLSN